MKARNAAAPSWQAQGGERTTGCEQFNDTTASLSRDWHRLLPDPAAYFRHQLGALGATDEDGWTTAPTPFVSNSPSSLRVDLQTGRWCCLATLQGGDLIDFHRRRHALDYRDAVHDLLRLALALRFADPAAIAAHFSQCVALTLDDSKVTPAEQRALAQAKAAQRCRDEGVWENGRQHAQRAGRA